MEPNLAGSIYGRSSIKFPHFVPIGQQTWPPRAILVSDWLILQKSSPLKLLGQMEPNIAGSIYGRSFTKLPHFVPIGQQTRPPRAILVSDKLIHQKSQFPHFILIGQQTKPPRVILVSDWLIFKKSSPLKALCQMKPNFTGSIYWRSFTKFPHFI